MNTLTLSETMLATITNGLRVAALRFDEHSTFCSETVQGQMGTALSRTFHQQAEDSRKLADMLDNSEFIRYGDMAQDAQLRETMGKIRREQDHDAKQLEAFHEALRAMSLDPEEPEDVFGGEGATDLAELIETGSTTYTIGARQFSMELVVTEVDESGTPLEAAPAKEWSGSPDPRDPDNFWIDDKTGERVNASTGVRSPAAVVFYADHYLDGKVSYSTEPRGMEEFLSMNGEDAEMREFMEHARPGASMQIGNASRTEPYYIVWCRAA